MQGNTGATIIAAWLRGLGQVAVVFVGTLLVTQQTLMDSMSRGDRWEHSAIAAGIAACFSLGWRGVGEGALDGYRQSKNISSSADVRDDTKP